MKKVLFIISIVCVALTMQSCPGSIGGYEPHGDYNVKVGVASILTSQDTIDVKDNIELRTLYPSNYLQPCLWFPERNSFTGVHELHVQKLSNNGESIVIEGDGIYINDELVPFSCFTDPSDTIFQIVNAFGKTETIVIKKCQVPYELTDVINQLEINYPHLVHHINDMEDHHFNSYRINKDELFPRIYIDEK